MTNMTFSSFDDFQDIEARNYYLAMKDTDDFDAESLLVGMARGSRDNGRTPMQWDASPEAGFTTGTPWMPVNANHAEINAEAAVADADSVFHYYRRLIELRHDHPVVVNGDFTMLLPNDSVIYAYTRSLNGVTLLVLGNFSSDEVPVPIEDADDWASSTLLLGNYPAPESGDGTLTLRPWEARIYLRD